MKDECWNQQTGAMSCRSWQRAVRVEGGGCSAALPVRCRQRTSSVRIHSWGLGEGGRGGTSTARERE